MRYVVTGGAGFIGSHVCDALLARSDSIICLDNLNDYYSPEQKKKNIAHNIGNPNFVFVLADITDKEGLSRIFEEHKPEHIIHLAARAGVRPSLNDPFIYEKTNVLGTLNLLELAVKHKIKDFVFGSSSSVYGLSQKTPFSEEDRTDNPISQYAATKKAGEVLCFTYHHLYDMNINCLRFFTVYGPRGRPDMAPYKFTKRIDRGDTIEMFGDGSSVRDYTYIADVVSGILAATRLQKGYQIFNLGNSKTVPLMHLVKIIEENLGKKARLKHSPMPKGDVPQTFADISKAKKLLKYKPGTSIEQGMKKFISWYTDEVRE